MDTKEPGKQPALDDSLLDAQSATRATRSTVRSFPELLFAFREARQLSKAELAKRAGLDASSITRFEQGQRAPERDSIMQLANAMVLPGIDRDRMLAAAGFRSEIWDDPRLVELVILLNDASIDIQARAEAESVLHMITTYLRMQRMTYIE